jgi:hypothetical protein
MALDPISAVLDIGGKLIDRLWPDPTQKAAAALELLKLQQSGELAQIAGQMDINKTEAANPSVFVAGWRPFVGWICGLGLGWDVIIRPTIQWGANLFGRPLVLAPLDLSTLVPLLMGMLGLGAMRSYDKTIGASNGH